MRKFVFFSIISFGIFFLSPYSTAAESVAITFDDGPSLVTTPPILEILARYQARATFFVTGVNAERYPQITRAIFEQGHQIGNHTYCHFDLQKSDRWALEWQISAAQNAIARIIGFRPKIFRPPYSRINEMARSILQAKGLKVIMWSVSPEDYKERSSEEIADRVLSQIKSGSIVVMHDYRQNTVLALPKILEGLREKRLRPVTVRDLGR